MSDNRRTSAFGGEGGRASVEPGCDGRSAATAGPLGDAASVTDVPPPPSATDNRRVAQR